MKLIYDKNLEIETIVQEIVNGEIIKSTITVIQMNALFDVRVELDSYVILETEKLLVDVSLIIQCLKDGLIDYNDLRKYLIVNILPNWINLSSTEQSQLKSYYAVPNDFVWDSNQSKIYKMLVDNATKCRESRIDQGRSYVSLFYIADIQKSMDFFIDTELLMNQYIKGKIPALEAFINDAEIAGFDYRENGFSTKSYYDQEGIIKDQLNYLLFR